MGKTFHYEFGGPAGTLAVTILLPIATLLLVHWSHVGYADLHFLTDLTTASTVLLPGVVHGETSLTVCGTGILGWFFFIVALERILPYKLVVGSPIGNSPGLAYRINGHLTFWLVLLCMWLGWPNWCEEHSSFQFRQVRVGHLYDITPELSLVTILLCFVLSLALYTSSYLGDKTLAPAGCSGNLFYDFWMGRELNPRIGSFDLKEFCELRPGLIGWLVVNLACMQKQHEVLGYVSGSMMLLVAFQGIYVWDGLYQEEAILTTMDITTEGFGFMLVFGDLAWVPFTYALQARYLVYHDPKLSNSCLCVIILVNLLGYWIFRGSNGEKNSFRRCKDEIEMRKNGWSYLHTKRGTKLLTSGWWGKARKVNYTGDWIMGLSWCLVCGFESLVPYFYAIYFFVLLIHRAIRDDALCAAKYGEDWKEYKKIVPFMFIPGLV